MFPLSLPAFPCTVLLLAASALAQGPAPGMRLYSQLGTTDTHLIDNQGNVVHTWPSTYQPGISTYLQNDGLLLRSILTKPPPIVGGGGGVQRVAFDGTVLWEYRYDSGGVFSHHDILVMPNGNVMLMAWEDRTIAQALAAGRNPAQLGSLTVLRPDHLIEVQPTGATSGTIVWQWHVWDHLIQDFDPARANFGNVAAHPERVDVNYPIAIPQAGDWNHFNGIDYDPTHDWIVISVPTFNEVWIIDHGTTTAQAAGHQGGRWGKGGDLLYRWGNPEAYRAGTAVDQQLGFEHDPRFIPPGRPGAGNLTIFNNRYILGSQSAAQEIVLPVDALGNFVLGPNGRYGPAQPLWSYTAPGFYSQFVSSAERLPNGNTLICSGAQDRLFEVQSNGTVVWQYQPPGLTTPIFHAHYVERTLWASTTRISTTSDNTVALDIATGTAHGGQIYLILGSTSGTTPGLPFQSFTIPLNFDYLFAYMYSAANSAPVLNQTLGMLDSRGRASGRFDVLGGVIPPALIGTRVDFASIFLDTNLSPTGVSNPVTLTIVP
jgi:hypothetical protein